MPGQLTPGRLGPLLSLLYRYGPPRWSHYVKTHWSGQRLVVAIPYLWLLLFFAVPFLIVLSSLIAVLYIGRIVEVAWFREPTGAVATATEAPLSMLIPIWILALACVLFGLDTEFSAGLAERAAAFMMGAGG